MKGKMALILIELTVMLLIFALAAALCLSAFVWSDTRSVQSSQLDSALLRLQNAAEALKHSRGDLSAAARIIGGSFDANQWSIAFDEEWEETQSSPAYRMTAVLQESTVAYLGEALLEILDRDGGCIARLSVCWQEVAP